MLMRRGAVYKPPGSWAVEKLEGMGWIAQDLCGRGRGTATPICGELAAYAPAGTFEDARSQTNSPLEAALVRLAVAKLSHPRLGPSALEWALDVEEQVGRMVVSTLTLPWPDLVNEDGEVLDYDTECCRTPAPDTECECSQCLLRQYPVVIDVGSRATTVGFAGQEGVASFPSVVARRRLWDSEPEPELDHQTALGSPVAAVDTARAAISENCTPVWETVAVGDAALAVENDGVIELVGVGHLGPAAIHYQVEAPAPSVSVDWNAMEAVWRHSFTGVLGTESTEHRLLLTEPPLNAKAHRERLVSLAFKSLGSPAVYLGSSAVLALYSSGRSTGTVIEIGASGSCISLVLDGYLLPHCSKQNNVGTTALGTCMLPALDRAGCVFVHAQHQNDCCGDLWHALGVMRALPPATNRIMQEDSTSVEDATFRVRRGLAGGHVDVSVVAAERLSCGEALLDPSVIGLPDPGLLHLLEESVRSVGANEAGDMWANLVLTGGGCVLPNLSQRLDAELKRIDPHRAIRCAPLGSKISASQPHGAIIGGIILASIDSVCTTTLLRRTCMPE